MMKKKCSSCAKKIERKFNYCPYCGESFKAKKEEDQYGFLGRDDMEEMIKQEEMRLPFGLNKIIDSLAKQLEKQMNDINMEEMNRNLPKGFKIKISTGQPGQQPQILQEQEKKTPRMQENITETEQRRRNKLPKTEAETKIRRLSDKIIYELTTPGVKTKKNVTISNLATGLEIRAYSKNKCYTKYIPLQVELTNYYIEGEKLYLECKA